MLSTPPVFSEGGVQSAPFGYHMIVQETCHCFPWPPCRLRCPPGTLLFSFCGAIYRHWSMLGVLVGSSPQPLSLFLSPSSCRLRRNFRRPVPVHVCPRIVRRHRSFGRRRYALSSRADQCQVRRPPGGEEILGLVGQREQHPVTWRGHCDPNANWKQMLVLRR